MIAPPTDQRAFAPDLPRNLRYLCGFYTSISDVCREIGINRHQFSKYTSGVSTPSLHNTNRIADFFGLDVEELCLPHEDLRRLFRRRTDRDKQTVPRLPSVARVNVHDLVDRLSSMNHDILKRFEGVYFRYNLAFDRSGRVIRSFFRVLSAGDIFVTRHIERIQHRSNGSKKLTTLKYDGVITAMSSCLFVVEYDRLMKSCVAHAAFPCISRPGQRFCTGVQSSFATSTGRPTASRVVLERLPSSMKVMDALRSCGTFERQQDEIDAEVIRMIDNRVEEGGDLLAPALV